MSSPRSTIHDAFDLTGDVLRIVHDDIFAQLLDELRDVFERPPSQSEQRRLRTLIERSATRKVFESGAFSLHLHAQLHDSGEQTFDVKLDPT